jgi:hypothetical protein
MKREIGVVLIIILLIILTSCSQDNLSELALTPTPTFRNTPSYTNKTIPSISLPSTKYPTLKPHPTPQVLEDGWCRFTYSEAGYSIDFPPDAKLETDNSVGLDFSVVNIRFPGSIDKTGVVMRVITYINSDNKSLGQFSKEKMKSFENENITITESIISNHSAIIYETDDFIRINVFISSGNKFYFILLIPNTMVAIGTTNEAVDLFKIILNTFVIF